MMMITFFYNLALVFLAILALPQFIYRLILHKKYRTNFFPRMGRGFPRINKNGRPLVWMHAVSFGETKAMAALAKLMKERHPEILLLVSSSTETAHAEALRAIPGADYHVYKPFDFPWLVYPIVRQTCPDLVLICESDIWYNFLNAVKQVGSPIVQINAKISDKSVQRFKWVPLFSKRLFGFVDLFCVQSVHYKHRFEKLGIASDKLFVTGNMKFDDEYPVQSPQELTAWKERLGIKQGDQVVVLGSTHHPEEELFLKMLAALWPRFPRLKVFLVPRHPERFGAVAGLLQKQGIPFERISKQAPAGDFRVLLIDAMGMLRKCYQIADIAIVGGSYTDKVGGHNILEPSWYGVPVLFGPHMHSQPEMLQLVKEYNAGLQVPPDQLEPILETLLSQADKRLKLGKAGLQLMNDMRGATVRTWERIQDVTHF